MNTLKEQELNYRLAELKSIVNAYNPKNEHFMTAVLSSFFIICLIVIFSVGLLFGLLLIGVGIVPLLMKSLDSKDGSPSEKALAEKAHYIMISCVKLYKRPDEEVENAYDNCMILSYSGDNISLYNEFISLFPQMASEKLKKLSSIKIGM